MTPGEWEQTKQTFEAAQQLGVSEREAYLDVACEGRPELREAVDELLNAHRQAQGFLDDSAPASDTRRVFNDGQLVAERFRITRFISRGGMGEVYEAYDEKLELRLALKTLRPEYAADNEALERFRREIRVAREVSHSSICRVFDLVEHHGSDSIVACLTMQLLEGESLQDCLRHSRPLSTEAAGPLIRQIAEALDQLHRNGIIHRDLKPSNIMLIPAGDGPPRVVVMDFGLAKMICAERGWFDSGMDSNAGAPYFMAPEQLRGERPGVATDLYAFGMIVDEMVTGSRAFPAGSPQSLYYRKLCEEPISPRQRNPGLPETWDRVIRRCLENDPADRYSAASEIVRDLLLESAAQPKPALRLGTRRPNRWALASLGLLVPVLLSFALFRNGATQVLNTSIVVFQISNLTGRTEFDYFCEGTNDEIMRRLTHLNGVRVIPYHEPRPNGPEPVTDARFALDGRLQESQGQVHLIVRLTDEKRRSLVWSREFNRELADGLVVQSEIATAVARSLEHPTILGFRDGYVAAGVYQSLVTPLHRLLFFQAAGVGKPPTASSAAFDKYMLGRHLWAERTVPSTLAAIQQFQEALKDDKSFALAYAALADAQFTLMEHDYAPQAQLLNQAREYAEQAVALGPDEAEAYTSLAAVRQQLWDWRGAESSYRHAIQLNPKLAQAHHWYAGMIAQFGRFQEALPEIQRALDLDPFDYPAQSAFAVYLFFDGQNNEAAERLQRLLKHRDLINAHVVLGYVYARLGTLASEGESSRYFFAKALQEADIVARREHTGPAAPAPMSDSMFALIHALAGKRSSAGSYLRRLTDKRNAGRSSGVEIAEVYIALGKPDAALKYLEQAARNKDKTIVYLRVQPFLQPLRDTRRFQSLLNEMKL